MLDNERYIKLEIKRKEVLQKTKELKQLAQQIHYFRKLSDKLENLKKFELQPFTAPKKDNKKEVIYLLADIHFRDKSGVKLLQKVFNVIKENKSEKEITIAFMGDEIDGLLHKNSIKDNIGTTESVILFQRTVLALLKDLSKTKKINLIFVEYSNHTQLRFFDTKRNEFHEEDVGKIIKAYLYDSTKDIKNIIWLKNENKVHDGVFKYKNNCFLHGHQSFSSTDNKLDFYLKRFRNKKMTTFVAHYHNYKLNASMENGLIVRLPALKNWQSPNEITNGYKKRVAFVKFEIKEQVINSQYIKMR